MTKQSTNALTYDAQTAEHASQSVAIDWQLIADAKRVGGMDSKAFRTSFIVGTIAGMLKGSLNAGAALLAKKAPLAKDADPEKKKARRAAIKAGTATERTADEQKVYMAATKRLSRFCVTHSIKPANKARGKPGSNKGDEAETKENTPKANNAATADKFMRQQCAMMLAYVEKNKAMLPDAMRHAVLELDEALKAIPNEA
jgi:hypothetical protein